MSKISSEYKGRSTQQPKALIFHKIVESMYTKVYHIMRNGDVPSLNKFIEQHQLRGSELESLLSSSYGKLKLRKVPLTDNMHFEVQSLLINLRLSMRQTTKEIGPLERICFICDRIKEIVDEEETDAFFLTLENIAINLHVLKRQLKSGCYRILPWEEMEFYILIFIHSKTNQTADFIYNLIVNRSKMEKHLLNFGAILEEQKGLLLKVKDERSNRTDIIKYVLSCYPEFSDLYKDHELLRDIHSLNRIEFYINTVVNCDNFKLKRIIIERTLQVIGEALKSTKDSPNISSAVEKLLMESAPKNLRQTIMNMRDFTSHADALESKISVLEEKDQNYFEKAENDLKKIYLETTTILFEKKTDALQVFFAELLRNDFNVRDDCFRNVTFHATFQAYLTKEMKNISYVFNEFKKQTNESIIEEIGNKIHNKLKRLGDYAKTFQYQVLKLIECLEVQGSSVATKMHIIERILSNRPHFFDYNDDVYNTVIKQSSLLINYNTDDTNMRNLNDIFTSLFEIRNIKNINYIKDDLETAEHDWKQKKVERVLSHLQKSLTGESRENFEKLKRFHEEKLSIRINKDIHRFKEYVAPDIAYKLEKLLSSNNFEEAEKLIKRLGDPYRDFMKSIKSVNMFDMGNYRPAIEKFCKALKLQKSEIEALLKVNEDKIRLCFKERITVLSDIIGDKINLKGYELLCAEMLILDLLEIIVNVSILPTDNFFLDDPSFVLTGKCLRNYVAHGNNLIDTLSFYPSYSMVAHGKLFIEKGIDHFLKKNTSKYSKEILFEQEYNDSLYIIKNQMKMFEILTTGDLSELRNGDGDIKGTSYKGLTALHYAAAGTYAETAIYLLQEGICDSVDVYGNTSLDMAIVFGNIPLVKHFLTSVPESHKKLLLHTAVRHHQIEVLKYLLQESLDPNETNTAEQTPLHFAAKTGDSEMVQLLLEHNASADAVDELGETPLHIAVRSGCVDVVELLLKHNPNSARVKNVNGYSPLHIAAEYNHSEIVDIFYEINGTDDVTNEGYSPLCLAAMNGNQEALDALLKHRANVEAFTPDVMGPLQLAAANGHELILRTLLGKSKRFIIYSKNS